MNAVEADSTNRITKITYPDMTMRNFKYDANGTLIQLWDRDGTIWKKGSGASWLQYRPDGKPTGQTRQGEIALDEKANCIYRDSETLTAWIEQPDGCRVTEAASGARIESGADGRSATYVATTSRRFAVSSEGFLRYETREGDSLTGIAFDAVCYRHFFEVGYVPTDEEVATEKRRLSRITSMDDIRGIPGGKTITIKITVETMTPEVMREVRQITRTLRAAAAEAASTARPSDSTAAVQETQSSSSKPRAPKDTAEMLLPWFSFDFESADDSVAPPLLPEELAENLGDRPAQFEPDTSESTRPAEPPAVEDRVSPAQSEPVTNASAKESAGRIAPWSKKAAAKTEVSTKPAEEPVKRVAPWSAKATESPSEQDTRPRPQEPVKRVAPWSAKGTEAKTEQDSGPLPQEPVKGVAPWASKTPARPDQTSAPPVQEPIKRVAPWSKGAPAAPAGQMPASIEKTSDAQQDARTRVELDGRGRVISIEYADETSKSFRYDDDGLLFEFSQSNGRVTRKNPDATWTSYARDGRQMNVSGKAALMVDREGNLIWEYQADGTALVQKVDGATVRITDHGKLKKYVSASDRVFDVTDTGVITYEVGADETLRDIAVDVVKAWHWLISFYEPGADEVDDVSKRILAANDLKGAAQISEGDVLSIPGPDDVAIVPLNALQRAVHHALLETLSAAGLSGVASAPAPDFAVDKDSRGQVARVRYPDQTVREFSYGADGDLVEIKHPDGRIHRKHGQESWLHVRADRGKSDEIEAVLITVDAEGNYTTESKSAGTKLTATPSGLKIMESSAGWKVTKNHNGHVIRVEYDDGTARDFQYSEDGELSSYKDRTGDLWTRTGKDAWSCRRPDGTISDTRPNHHVSVNKDGNFIQRDVVSGSKTTETPNRSKVTKYKDFSELEFDLRGRAVRFRSKAQRIFSLSAGGVLLYEAKAGDTLAAIALDALCYAHREKPDYKPGPADLEEQSNRIATHNNLGSDGVLSAGDMLVIPPHG